jgi:hypothetical protein
MINYIKKFYQWQLSHTQKYEKLFFCTLGAIITLLCVYNRTLTWEQKKNHFYPIYDWFSIGWLFLITAALSLAVTILIPFCLYILWSWKTDRYYKN